jgi:hypothetical protein
MTDETPKPKRKRWRWGIAGALLFVVCMVWWYWPRGDARFVGKWQTVVEKANQEITTGEEWRFYRHGLVYHRNAQERFEEPMRWSIEGKELVLGVDWPVPNYGLKHWGRRIWNRVTGVAKPLHFEILKVAADEIHTRFVERPEAGVVILRRISE